MRQYSGPLAWAVPHRAAFPRQRRAARFRSGARLRAQPLFLLLGVLLLIVVTSHALLGVRAILLDFGVSARAEKVLSRALTVVGILTVGYGLWVTWVVIH